MIQLSIITDEMTQDLSAAIRFAKAYHLQGLELRTVDNQPLEALSLQRLKELRQMMDAEGLSVCNLAGSFFKCTYDNRAGEMDKLKRLLQAADVLGADTIRGFAFFQEEGLQKEQIKEAFEEPISLLKASGKMLLLEADPSVYTTNHWQLRELLDYMNSPQLGAIYDPGNDIYDPEHETPYPDGWQQIAPYVKHIHIKDAVIGPNGPECVCIGTGLVDYAGICTMLSASGYAGYLSLETHYRKGQDAISEEMMRLPGGADFSAGGLEAAAESALALQDLLKRHGAM